MTSSTSMLGSEWRDWLGDRLNRRQFDNLLETVARERRLFEIYPPTGEVFTAFRLTPPSKVRAVILGQDPYHGPGQAHGLSFSVPTGVRFPRSLNNIFREMAADLSCEMPLNGDLSGWARNGVLLLNSILTVRRGVPGSHSRIGWQWFTDLVISNLAEREIPCVFALWGAAAQSKLSILGQKHGVIVAPHPSPFSAHRGFFGSRPFTRINRQLRKWKLDEIPWTII